MSTWRVKKTDIPNEGVVCTVDTCYYYLAGNHCGAEQIEVRPKNASNSQDTDCATFVPDKPQEDDTDIPQFY